MSELTIQQGIQAAIQAMDEFADGDVVINDWSVLDGETSNAPYVIITTADDFDSRQDTVTPNTRWDIMIYLVVRWLTWNDTLTDFRDYRQAIIDKINSGTGRSAGGIAAVSVNRIYNGSGIEPVYDPYLTPEQLPEAMPDFLQQLIVLETEEY
jgi:hypothetical protein